MQHGYAVTPVYTFGETDTYYTFTGMLKQRLMLNKQNIPGVLFFGEPWVPLFPRTAAECFHARREFARCSPNARPPR